MKRRNFFKGLFGAYAAISSYFSYKYFEEKNNKKNITEYKLNNRCDDDTKGNFDKKIIGLIGMPIVYHCNLNCACCDHFAPIAPKHQIPFNVLKNDFKQLSKIINNGGELKVLWIIGGEPLLHDELPEILKAARFYFPNTKIELTTNGFLIDKQDDAFWQACSQNNIKIIVENYIRNDKNIDFDKICAKLKEFHCDLRINGPKYQFKPMDLTKEIAHNAKERYDTCFPKLWPIIDNGKFYPCSVINGVDKFFNKSFPSYSIPVAKEDVLDIYKINSLDELIEFYEKPKSFCAHCNYFISPGRKWKHSKKEVSEWYKV